MINPFPVLFILSHSTVDILKKYGFVHPEKCEREVIHSLIHHPNEIRLYTIDSETQIDSYIRPNYRKMTICVCLLNTYLPNTF